MIEGCPDRPRTLRGPWGRALGLAALGWGLAATAAEWPLTGQLITHDPTVIREGGTWWLFETGAGLPVKSSADGRAWTQRERLFNAELPWWRTHAPAMGQLDVWAPDAHRFNGRIWLFYSVSAFGQNNSAIGLLSCSSIAAGDWRGDGLVLSSRSGVETFNAIDPGLVIDADGAPWLVFGSWFSGIQLVRLDPATMKPTGPIQRVARRSNGIEAPNIVRAHGFYYLFLSFDRCCLGANSTYRIAVGRATSIAGPYLDRAGVALDAGGNASGGTILEAGGERWKGPGGQFVLRDVSGWVLARHAYDLFTAGLPTLRLSDLVWDAEAWPAFTAAGPPVMTVAPADLAAAPGAGGALQPDVLGAGVAYVWSRDGVLVANAEEPTLAFTAFAPADAGLYRVAVANAEGAAASGPVVVGAALTAKLAGAAEEVGRDIVHPNGNIYDQLLLTGPAASFTADAGQITRLSYIDPGDDIVQVEFAGAGTVTVTLEDASGPAPPLLYNQPTVAYMKGRARLVVTGADETTNLSVFSVGRANAVNQALFRAEVTYDGHADVASLALTGPGGRAGGVRAANARFGTARGVAGVFAPGLAFSGPVFIGDIAASGEAEPMLRLGAAGDVRITGGNLAQPNGRAVQVSGFARLQFVNGETSHAVALPAQSAAGRLEEGGVDVTEQRVQNPGP